MGFLLWIRKPRIKTPPPLHARRWSPLTNRPEGLSHAYSVGVLTVNRVRQRKWSNGRRGENVPASPAQTWAPGNVEIKKVGGVEGRVHDRGVIVVSGPYRRRVWTARTSLRLSALGVELVSQCKPTKPERITQEAPECPLQSCTNMSSLAHS